jgi:hypothetical protein
MMKRTIRTGITGALLLGGVAGLTALGNTTPDSIPEPAVGAPFVTNQSAGRIELATKGNGTMTISYFGPSWVSGTSPTASTSYAPAKRSDKCLVDLTNTTTTKVTSSSVPAGKTILDLSIVEYTDLPDTTASGTVAAISPAPLIGLVDSGLGSSDGKNCNRSNGRLEPISWSAANRKSEGFKISLGSYFAAGTGVAVDKAVFDIEGKYGARFEAITNASGKKDWFAPLGNASDNDADSGGTDNDQVIVGDPGVPTDDFTSVVLAPVSSDGRGQLALEGGGDFSNAEQPAKVTVLYLGSQKSYEYTLVCTSPTPEDIYAPNSDGSVKGIVEDDVTDWGVMNNPGGTADYPDQARVFRYAGYENTDGVYHKVEGALVPKDCPPIGADLDGSASEVELVPSDDSAFLRVELTWVIPGSLVDFANDADFERQIDIDGNGFVDARSCDGFDRPATNPPHPNPAFDASAPGVVDHVAGTELVPWCVLSDTRQLAKIGTTDVVIQTMVWDGLGDPRWA